MLPGIAGAAGIAGGVINGPSTFKNIDLITSMALTSNLKLCLEAGDIASWPGSGTKWLDRSGGGYDFYLGPDATSSFDPIFNGVAGNQSRNEFWSSISCGFTYDSANESWMNNIHKDSAKFSIALWQKTSTSSVDTYCGDDRFSGNIGFHFFASLGSLQFKVLGAAGSNVFTSSTLSLTAGDAWRFVGISVDEAANTYTLFKGDSGGFSSVTGACTYSSPSASAAVNSLCIGDAGNQSSPATGKPNAAMIWEQTTVPLASFEAMFNYSKFKYGL